LVAVDRLVAAAKDRSAAAGTVALVVAVALVAAATAAAVLVGAATAAVDIINRALTAGRCSVSQPG
jgi:hypothetical protein